MTVLGSAPTSSVLAAGDVRGDTRIVGGGAEPNTEPVSVEVPDPACRRAFERGYDDARTGRSDFARRGYSFLTGERTAYMDGRAAYHADKKAATA